MPNPIEVLVTTHLSEGLISDLKGVSTRLRVRYQPARKSEEISPEILERAEVLFTDNLIPDPESMPNLQWIQFAYAGIEFVAGNKLLEKPGLRITTMSGASASQIGEYVVLMMLALGHKMSPLFQHQIRHEWPADAWERFSPLELRGSTVGLVGYGSIGRQVARLLRPFGVQILAAKRDVMHPEDTGYTPEGMGDPNGDFFARLYPVQALGSMFKECDFIILTLPLTSQTYHLVGEAELASCKPGAYLINVSRGDIIDQEALVKALQEKKLGGAALDVFQKEPLPADHVLWSMPEVLITPHISGDSAFYDKRAVDLFQQNLDRYQNGEPLFNLYRPELEY